MAGKFDLFLAREQLVLAKAAIQEAASLLDKDYKKIIELIEEEIKKLDRGLIKLYDKGEGDDR